MKKSWKGVLFTYGLRCIFISACIFYSLTAIAQEQEHRPTVEELKQLSIEELTNVEVTLVSRSPQKLTEATSAIQVITNEDIRRSGATNLAEALRLVSNLQVAQLNANAWLISARGFNTIFANKLLVMIDGRTVYTPLFGGVLWEMQHVLLEDIQRIEVVSGPGGTLWGANAVNGIINIITKNSNDSKGFYASALAGSFIRDHVAVRFGDQLTDKVSYRVYGQHFNRNSTRNAAGDRNHDDWGLSQGGFRFDWKASETSDITAEGNYYRGLRQTVGEKSAFNGQNILSRWSKRFEKQSELQLQVYFDRYYWEDVPTKSTSSMNTWDIDFQYRVPIGQRHVLLAGVGYRAVKDNTVFDTPLIGILPEEKRLDLASGFIQDEISLSKRVKFTLGSKIIHNVYTGFDLQPSARFAVHVAKDNTLWAAVSRAVRTPSRYDRDYYLPTTPAPPATPSVAGGPNFESEKVLAYELGYRIKPGSTSSLSLAFFYNDYADLYSVETLPGTLTYQIQNGSRGKSWGAELSGSYQVSNRWRLRGGYTFFERTLEAKPKHNFNPDYLANDVKNQVLLQSVLDLSDKLQFDLIGRHLSRIHQTTATVEVPAYLTFDARLACQVRNGEIALVGQNLWRKAHTEFQAFQIPRSVYVKVAIRL